MPITNRIIVTLDDDHQVDWFAAETLRRKANATGYTATEKALIARAARTAKKSLADILRIGGQQYAQDDHRRRQAHRNTEETPH